MKFSPKGIAITLCISIVLTACFSILIIQQNAKQLRIVLDAIVTELPNVSSVEEAVELSITTFGYEYEAKAIQGNEKITFARSENFGSQFVVQRKIVLGQNEIELSLHMSDTQFFNVLTLVLFFFAVQGIGFAIIAPSQSDKKSREILYDITYKDSLTGAFNRKRLSRFFNARKLDNNAPFSMFYADINNFNALNEKYGRHMGDDILKAFTKHLDSYVRDAIIVRLDGDDFVVTITGDFSEDILHSIKHRLDHAFSKPLVVNDSDIRLSVAVAYSSFPREGQSLEKLLAVCAQRVMEVKNNS